MAEQFVNDVGLRRELWDVVVPYVLGGQEELQKAIDIFASVGPEDWDYDDHLYLGLVFQAWGDYENQVGSDALIHWGKAIDAYLAAIRLDDRQTPAWINLGTRISRGRSRPIPTSSTRGGARPRWRSGFRRVSEIERDLRRCRPP